MRALGTTEERRRGYFELTCLAFWMNVIERGCERRHKDLDEKI